MFSFKKSLIALVGILVISVAVATLMPFAISGQDKPLKRDPRRSFYLTQTSLNGGQPLTACAEGYHMASLWEIFDPSNLRYDTELGLTSLDSGSGPPSLAEGWIRTGNNANASHCQVWTSANAMFNGTVVNLETSGGWTEPARAASPWLSREFSCNVTLFVWCVQD